MFLDELKIHNNRRASFLGALFNCFFISCLFLSYSVFSAPLNFGKQIHPHKNEISRILLKEYKKELRITWIRTIQDPLNLSYVVRSKIYPEDPNTLFLTMRGGGITLLDITRPLEPNLIQHWDDGKKRVDMEGQSRIGKNFFTIGRNGAVYSFEILPNKTLKKIGYLDLSGSGLFGFFKFTFGPIIPALHCQTYKKDGKTFLFISSTWSKKIRIINITNPKEMVFVSKHSTGISGIEGIQIYGDYVYTGGFRSKAIKVFKIESSKKIRLVGTLKHKNYKQMVPQISDLYPDVLFTALWGKNGGIASFSLKNPEKITQLGMMAHTDFSRSNRVKVSGNYAYLPLEQSVGGIGVVRISDVKNMNPILTLKKLPGIKKPYTLNFKNDVIYLFGSTTNSMAILKVEKLKRR